MSHFSFKRTPGVTSKQERTSQQSGLETGSSPLSSYSQNWPSRGVGGDGDRSIPQPNSRFSLNTSGSSSSLPRHFDTSRLSSTLSGRRSLSPTREADGSRLPRIPEDPNLHASTRRFLVKEEMSSPDTAAPSRPLFGGAGKQSDEGGIGFRFSATTPSLSRLSQSASAHPDVRRGSRDLQRSPSRHSSREVVTATQFDLNLVASQITADMKNAQTEIEELKHDLGD
ncbi:hypothetical protein BDM02DRAFT_202136 [Thelephora ganbajun]|uniref:Uncharacterized protein n=1 Tax=Thelephora ganbajun TaxID=370292 RepID=A0ACB6ZRW4_THEGA|nr:hypothetical protein BDM02DRAFT_202136 [Thelephora ganbajun]